MDHPQEIEQTWLILLPLLIVLSTFLFLLLLFLICLLLIRRRRGIVLRDSDGPVDMSREDQIEADGGFDNLESRWLESLTDDNARRAYIRAKDYQLQYLPNSLPTDITLSQFLSIQEKGVSAWSFEPDFETVNALLVHARTEITFLPDPASASSVQSNLPLPKLNEVYYWEVKMFDLPESTNVAIGLATKPYPSFRLPGLNRYSIAYHSSGDKSYNYPFTAQTYGAPLKEGDVLGVGYRPRSGTVFYTRNGRKMEDAFTGLNRWNLFPTIGADGPCSVHVNLGQAGFVFVEANVKKWGLAPSVGTLAPPPAYGSERGSILLDVGGRIRSPSPSASSTPPRRTHRSRRPRPASGELIVSSPLRTSEPITPPPPITPIDEEPDGDNTSRRYISPTDMPFHAPPNTNLPPSPRPNDSQIAQDSDSADDDAVADDDDNSSGASTSRASSPDAAGAINPFSTPRRMRRSLTHLATSLSDSGAESYIQVHPPPDSPMSPPPPTPNPHDIHLQALTRSDHRRTGSSGSQSTSLAFEERLNSSAALTRRDPPEYSPLDALVYSEGVNIDLPAEVITAALEGGTLPASVLGQSNRSSGRRSRRR
ncbi:concanavalin A-like lectin/glucanase domain-containing protein [Rhodocollybia butyracea]|uniref:Concanavalin A-like lectin/glucanase domain-containing protein n=1 Tax=Rhodocollybia butyracea TaxID=206335 RepID=A0A9P5U6Q8_9AGAR|nr:concanavalin A-like lectin/glucanase domain-containing protein [Rhodocollybia butyracea]